MARSPTPEAYSSIRSPAIWPARRRDAPTALRLGRLALFVHDGFLDEQYRDAVDYRIRPAALRAVQALRLLVESRPVVACGTREYFEKFLVDYGH